MKKTKAQIILLSDSELLEYRVSRFKHFKKKNGFSSKIAGGTILQHLIDALDEADRLKEKTKELNIIIDFLRDTN